MADANVDCADFGPRQFRSVPIGRSSAVPATVPPVSLRLSASAFHGCNECPSASWHGHAQRPDHRQRACIRRLRAAAGPRRSNIVPADYEDHAGPRRRLPRSQQEYCQTGIVDGHRIRDVDDDARLATATGRASGPFRGARVSMPLISTCCATSASTSSATTIMLALPVMVVPHLNGSPPSAGPVLPGLMLTEHAECHDRRRAGRLPGRPTSGHRCGGTPTNRFTTGCMALSGTRQPTRRRFRTRSLMPQTRDPTTAQAAAIACG